MTDLDLRASDAERESVVADLRAHAGEGRLTVDELDERLERAYAAKTRAELTALTADLPSVSRARERTACEQQDFRQHLQTYVAVMALLVAIWALTGMGYFWPIWPGLGWGIGIVSHGSAVRTNAARRHRRLTAGG